MTEVEALMEIAEQVASLKRVIVWVSIAFFAFGVSLMSQHGLSNKTTEKKVLK